MSKTFQESVFGHFEVNLKLKETEKKISVSSGICF